MSLCCRREVLAGMHALAAPGPDTGGDDALSGERQLAEFSGGVSVECVRDEIFDMVRAAPDARPLVPLIRLKLRALCARR